VLTGATLKAARLIGEYLNLMALLPVLTALQEFGQGALEG
jgi:hypothetical protein